MPFDLSILMRILSEETGAEKLGQPVPESNLVSDKKSAVPQQAHW
jgi:hypothetical protein